MAEGFEIRSRHRSFGGRVTFCSHRSVVNSCEMRFSVFEPPEAAHRPVPVVTWLSGLSCTEENFMVKAGAQRLAAELGLMIVVPDTSPRGEGVADDPDSDLGQGAGFYVDATRQPWSAHYRMYSYVTQELPALVGDRFPADLDRQGIFGHSMGGHGALVIGLRNPETYASVSAFAPISAPARSPWGSKAFAAYLGDDPKGWRDWDATDLVGQISDARGRSRILVDQGLDDAFLEEQLMPDALEEACARANYPLELRRHPGYDHSYYFIASFIDDHLSHHAGVLG
jgi:S-formylglutathione hydrolase